MKKILVSLLAGLALVLTGASAPALASEDGKGGRIQAVHDWDLTKDVPKVPGRKATDRLLPNTHVAGVHRGLPDGPAAVKAASLPHTLGTGDYRAYAVGSQAIANTGVYGNFTVAYPQLDSTNDGHTLGEVAVQDAAGNAIEIGWRHAAGSANTVMFGSIWQLGAFHGYNVGCTDVNTGGQNLNDTLTLGTAKMGIQWDAPSAAWWLSYANQWVCYFPATLFSAGSGLRTGSSNFYQLFYEMQFSRNTGGTGATAFSCSDLGTGYQGSAGSPNAAIIGSTTLVGIPSTSVNLFERISFGGGAVMQGAAPNQEWSTLNASTRTFYGGGPGRTNTNSGLGTQGSC